MASSIARRLPSLPSLPKIKAAVNPCQCGCGAVCTNRFKPGHDAKLAGYVRRVQVGVVTLEGIEEILGVGQALATAHAMGVDYTPLAEREDEDADEMEFAEEDAEKLA